jgi:membrane protease YdiL (CAAX protease family)
MADANERELVPEGIEVPEGTEVPSGTELPPPKRGKAWLAWTAIAVSLVVIFVLQQRSRTHEVNADDQAESVLIGIQAKYMVGAQKLVTQQDRSAWLSQIQALNTGPVGQRLRYVTLVGEMAGAEKASAQLRELDERMARNHIQPDETQKRLRAILGRLYDDRLEGIPPSKAISNEDQEFLRQKLDWFGRLALAPADTKDSAERDAVLESAHRTFVTCIVLFIGLGVVGLVGLVALVLVIALLLARILRSRIETGIPHGGIYAETFALWLILYFAMLIGVGAISDRVPFWIAFASGALLSLGILLWPVWRGVPWSQVRQEIGWTRGRGFVLEALLGVGTHMSAIPMLVAAALFVVVWLAVQNQLLGAPSLEDHFEPVGPQAQPLFHLGFAKALFLVSFVAPVVEETMFRGVLYRHLREASHRFPFFLSGAVSATVVSFIFAIVHPYGFIGVPILMALAYSFSLYREWRGTLLPAMVAHAIHNGLVLTLMFVALSQ